MKTKIAILGSTGSIGNSSLEIIKKKKKKFYIELIYANQNFKEINRQIKQFNPRIIIVNNFNVYCKLKKKYKKKIILNNFKESKKFIKKFDILISAIPGIQGLEPTIFFTKYSKKVLIANKESIICGWKLIYQEAKKNNSKIVSIDSEHFTINFILKDYSLKEINKIYITASGGPFLNFKKNDFKTISPQQAIKHPKWKMGKKISIDSSTMMNKILETIEAVKLFRLKPNQFEILIHPQSLVHSIIELKNGLRLFVYHETDMKIPIGNELGITDNYLKKISFKKKIQDNLNFYKPDIKKFPILSFLKKINYENSSPILINAANEILVDEFLKKKISFNDIYRHLKLFLNTKNYIKTSKILANNIKKIKIIDQLGRKLISEIIKKNV